jgi:hypothetical protein
MTTNFETESIVQSLQNIYGLGHIIENAPSSNLKLAELDWKVSSVPVIVNGKKVSGYKANIRSTDGSLLGIVSSNYKIIQNEEAFAFMYELLGEKVTFETVGSLNGGKRIWILANIPEESILDDEAAPYLVFTNNHDAHAVQVCQTTIRVVDQNSLNMALRKAKKHWIFNRVGDIFSHTIRAQTKLGITNDYTYSLKIKAEKSAAKKIFLAEYNKILDETLL